MAEAVASLKSELKHFQDTFPSSSSGTAVFAVKNYTLDEVSCVFYSDDAKKKHVINCTISVSFIKIFR